MPVRLIESNVQCPDCKFTKIRLHVCRPCMVVIFSTVFVKAAKCPRCRSWVPLESESKCKPMPGFAEWYYVDSTDDFNLICELFRRHGRRVLGKVMERQQLTLNGF